MARETLTTIITIDGVDYSPRGFADYLAALDPEARDKTVKGIIDLMMKADPEQARKVFRAAIEDWRQANARSSNRS